LQFLEEVELASKKAYMTRLRSKLFAMSAVKDARWKESVSTIIYPTYRQSQAAEVQVRPSHLQPQHLSTFILSSFLVGC